MAAARQKEMNESITWWPPRRGPFDRYFRFCQLIHRPLIRRVT